MATESYHDLEPQSNIAPTIRLFLDMLENGTADRGFLAMQFAKYAAQEPDLVPLVHELAGEFDEAFRAQIMARKVEAQQAAAQPKKPKPPKPSLEPQPVVEVRMDPELARIALGLGLAAQLRIWLVLRHHFGVSGGVDRQVFYETLQEDGIEMTRRHYNRLLKAGDDVFWGIDHVGRVWLRGYQRVAERLTAQGMAENPDLVLTNYPGVLDIYVRVDGKLKTFRARIYAAWLTHRNDPKIARATLCKLFSSTTETLQGWEQTLPRIITVIPSYTQTAVDPKDDDDRLVDYLPEHAYNYLTRNDEVCIRWQSPNVYRTKMMRQHPRKGQSRKVRVAAAKVIAGAESSAEVPVVSPAQAGTSASAEARSAENSACPHPERDWAFGRDHWETRQYFADEQLLRRYVKWHEQQGIRVADRFTPETPCYVYRGQDRNDHAIYEVSLDGLVRTTANERISIKKEYVWRKAEAETRRKVLHRMAAR